MDKQTQSCEECWNFDPKHIHRKEKSKPYCVKKLTYLEKGKSGWLFILKTSKYFVGNCKFFHKGNIDQKREMVKRKLKQRR